MRIGRLRKRLTVQERGAGLGTQGQPNGAWTSLFSAWGEIEPLSGRESIAAAAAQSEVSHRISLRYRAGVALSAKHRILYAGRYFNIRAVRDDGERHRVWILDCTEANDQGGIG